MVNKNSKRSRTVNDALQKILVAKGSADQSHLMRTTQAVRVSGSMLPVAILFAMAIAIYLNHYNKIQLPVMGGWLACLAASAIFEKLIHIKVSASLADASFDQLIANDRWLFLTVTVTNLCVGSCFWWLLPVGAQEGLSIGTVGSLNNTLLLFCVIYALVSLRQLSIQLNAFVLAASANLGQVALFHLGVAGPFEPIITVGLVLYVGLLSSFSRENTKQFSDGILIQDDNLSLLDQLNLEKDSVDSALEKAEIANDTKNQFLAAASHDLRQPLYALSLYLGSLEQVIGTGKGRDIVDKMSDTAAFLNDQFNSLLDLAQFDAGAITVRETTFELTPLLDRLVASFDSQAKQKDLDVIIRSDDILVTTDPQLLERVLRNILENAIRYTDQGRIEMTAVLEAQGCRISIIDTGKGISPENQNKIFNDFVQVGNSARNKEHGVGLGLAIVSRICTLLDHPLELESELGKGSTFRLSLPGALHTQNKQTHLKRSQDNLLQDMRVWVLDDNNEILDALNMQLEAWGCTVTLLNCEQALKIAFDEQGSWPNLLMLDDMLGEHQSGLDIARSLSDQMDVNRMALITGNTQGDRLKEIGQSGFQCLLKPVANWELKNLLTTVMEDTHALENS